jgi:beta-N-acetylhexosaminidase
MVDRENYIYKLTLAEKVGQMLFFGWQGANSTQSQRVNEHAEALIDDLAVGNIIFMGRNVDTRAQMRAVTSELQERNRSHGRPPLFLGVDQEGGRVNRLVPPHFTRQPSAKSIGDTNDPGQARDAAAATGRELLSVGLNWDFAPVLDVNNNPHNPVIGDRSFGDDPELVSRMGVAAIAGFQEDACIIACGKHFPGHGDTDVDSHLALPVVNHDRDRLEQIELRPFKAAIAAGVGSIISAHIRFTKIDPDLPATLSSAILTGILRRELGFEGLITTDCLEMKGIADHWGPGEAAVLAVEAGADLLLACHTWTTQSTIRDALLAAVESGRIGESRIDESVGRILAAKSRWIATAV